MYASDNSQVFLKDYTTCYAWENSTVKTFSDTCTINAYDSARVFSQGETKVNLYGFATHIISGRDGQLFTSGYDKNSPEFYGMTRVDDNKVELYRMLRRDTYYANREYLDALNEEYLAEVAIDFTRMGLDQNVVLR